MSETASDPRTALSVFDPTQAEIPAQLWLRSGRPFFGTAVRVYVCFALIAGALIFVAPGPVFWGMIGAAVLAYFLFPLVIQGLLAPLERRVLAARRREATALLQEVRARRLVRQFAPHAWLTLQEGRLHLRRGDGRAAARAFTETVRLSKGADAPALLSAQAQALLIAEQPEQARELLQSIAKRQALAPADRLHLGLALLGGKGHGREALEHVQAAHAALGEHPRVLAALALALHRVDETEPALAALQRAQDSLGGEPDPFDEGLVQRGVKLLRTAQKAQQKRARKVEVKVEAKVEAKPAAPAQRVAAPVKPEAADAKAKSARKVKKDERRAARRAAKQDRRQAPEPARASKAAKVAPQGKAAKVAMPARAEAKAGAGPSGGGKLELSSGTGAGKPGEAATPVAPATPTAVKVSEQVSLGTGAVKPSETPVAVKVSEQVSLGTGAVKSSEAATPVTPTAVKVSEQVSLGTGAVKPSETATPATPVAVKVSQQVSSGTGAEKLAPGTASARPPTPSPAAGGPAWPAPVSAPASSAPRAPAPPAGASLFGSLGAKPGASGPTSAPPRAPSPLGGLSLPPPRPSAPATPAAPAQRPADAAGPVASSPATPRSSPPSPSAAVTPTVATPTVAASSVAPSSITPVAAPSSITPGAAPSLAVPPVAASVPAPVAPPTLFNKTTPPSLGIAPLTAPTLPKPPVLSAPNLAAPVVVPAAAGAPRPGSDTPSSLAQVLPDTDDAWDDMLDALEADSPGPRT